MNYELFMENAPVMLYHIPAKIYKCALQATHVTTLGWLFGTHEDVPPPQLEQLLHEATHHLAPPTFTPI